MLSKIIALFACCFGAANLYGQGFAVNLTATTTVSINGTTVLRPLPNAASYICSSNNTVCVSGNAVPVYSDAALTTVIAQPVIADKLGNFFFYVSGGQYKYTIYNASQSLQTYPFTASLNGCDNAVSCIISNPVISQVVTQPDGTSFTPNRQNGVVYNVREWCATPGVLDDTCFSRAITNIASHGFVGYAGHIYAELVVSPEIYTFAHQVTIPAGINIGIHGTMESGVYGSTVNTDASDAFLVLSDNVDIQHISFFGTPAAAAKHNGIVLGSSTVEVFDSHINWNWFINQNYAIRAVNVSGLDISHNTWDSGTSYGFFSDSTAGDVKVQDIIAVGVRGFNEINVFKIHGDGTDNYSDILVDGIFDNTQAGSTAIDINNVRSVKITGNFNNNPYDILLTGVNGAVVGPFTGHNNYLESIRVVSSNNVGINNGSYTNVGLGQSASGYLIDVTGSNGTIVHAVSSISTNGTPTGNVLNGLHIDATSTGSDVFANNLKAQTGAAEVNLDASTVTPMSGIKVGASVVNGVGMQHTRQSASSCNLGSTAGTACTVTFMWPVPMANGNYTATCMLESVSGITNLNGINSKTATSMAVQISNGANSPATVGLIDCKAMHD
jgi:hypothetical protein